MLRPLLLLSCLALATGLQALVMSDQVALSRDQDLAATIATTQRSFVFIESASGVIIDDDGHMLTNYHVVYDQRLNQVPDDFVVRADGRFHRADLVGFDPVGDIAMLRITSTEPLPPVPIADADTIRIGQPVYALGNPFGASRRIGDATVTTGLISAMHRFIGAQGGPLFPDLIYPDALQTDTPINPGNSGGPLFNNTGELLGINGQIRTRFGARSNTGIGLAIPMTQIAHFLPAMRAAEGGPVFHGVLRGLVPGPREPGDTIGALIADVRNDSQADRIGLQKGDHIISIDGERVTTWNRCHGLLFSRPAGHKVRIGITRGAERLTLKGVLEAYRVPMLGLRFIPIRNPRDQADLTIRGLVDGLPAADSGVQVGDRLLAINDAWLRVQNDIPRILTAQELLAGDAVTVVIQRGGQRRTFTFTLADKFALQR